MEQPTESIPPIINCHTHIFTAEDVPPYLAKTIVPWPLHFIIHTGGLAGLIGAFVRRRNSVKRKEWYKKLCRALYLVRMALKRYWILILLKVLIIILILVSIFYDQYETAIKPWLIKNEFGVQRTDDIYNWLRETGLVIRTDKWIVKAFWLFVLLLLFPLGRNILWGALRLLYPMLKFLPGKQTKELAKRYLNIVRFANYKEQFKVYSRLKLQYPPGSKMIILPMDMRFMNAGAPPRSYYKQMDMLNDIKQNHEEDVFPFIFVDPRRMDADGKSFFAYRVQNNKVILENCFIKDYIETKEFSGFKIYPALGYYPFDERLLPLWKYAADNGIPIMTHCIRGVIYYRGRKLKDWDYHPVFEEFMGDDKNPKQEDYQPLLLKQMKPVAVQEIFTHPMNYVCLYKKMLLQKLVSKAKDQRIRDLFGFDAANGTISHDLGHLKICFGHFGGEDEWLKFFEADRSNYGHQLIRYPDRGIDFLETDGKIMPGKPEQLWKDADWYSLICSLMLQHDNVYADISYILHGDLQIMPLLRSTLQHPKLKTRVLYGSDFFVVRNHKSDKNMLADMRGGLLKDEFNQIACVNPVKYLERKVY